MIQRCIENVFIDHNLQKKIPWAFAPPAWWSPGDRSFQEIPFRVIMVGAMPALTKNPGYVTESFLVNFCIFPIFMLVVQFVILAFLFNCINYKD